MSSVNRRGTQQQGEQTNDYLSNRLTWFAAPAELDGRDVEQVHAVQVVVDEELQQEGDVALVGLVALVHHGAAL